ncbi:MAG: DUF1015 domain-containing protein [Deltaproteobacteria bacterium]|nr:DUF1015 domain-containing protein [Deltaproteobacteria bacterium]
MAIIVPFRGLTYNFKKITNLSQIITPPYDIISEKEQDSYYNTHPNNIIRLELGKKMAGDNDSDNRYTRAANYLKEWETDDILTRAKQDTLYLTSHSYDPGDGSGTKVRWGFMSLIKIEEEGSGVILPHEKTFSAHKDDRLKLLKACSTQLSQVFGLYDDAGSGILDTLRKFTKATPDVSFTFTDGTGHKMWCITDPEAISKVKGFMAKKPIFIADGHHRYETSRNFRNYMRGKHGAGPEKSYEYVMMYLTDMGEDGLTILPSHRLIKMDRSFDPALFLEKAEPCFNIEKLKTDRSNELEFAIGLKNALAQNGLKTPSFIFYSKKEQNFYLMGLKNGVADELLNDLHPSLKKLDVIILSRLILEKVMEFTKADMDNDSLFHYDSNIASTISSVDSGEYDIAFLINPTKIGQVQEIASASQVMPRKSTYFYPKVLTGMVLNKIDPDDRICIQ